MKLVVGATGLLGGLIASSLLDQGQEVRILVRQNSPSEEMAKQGLATSAQALIDAGAQPVYGDLKEPASLKPAVAGVDTVITTANSVVRGGDDNTETVDRHGNRNLIDAARQAGVKQFIFTSVYGASADSPAPFVQAKAESEARLRESGMPYTILAPNIFMEVWFGILIGMPLAAGQPVTLVGSGSRKHSFVSMADVASFAVAAVDNPDAINQHIAIGGPEPISYLDAVAAFERTTGAEIPVRFVSPGEAIPGVPDAVAPIAAAHDSYDSPIEMVATARRYGVELTPVDNAVGRMLARAAN
jgi:NADH dehydrogenase